MLVIFLCSVLLIAYTAEAYKTGSDYILDELKKTYIRRASAPKIEDKWIEQKLDHFDEDNVKTWKQRYHENGEFYNNQTKPGPVFLLAGGEGQIDPMWMEIGFWTQLGETFGAHLFHLENRFFGMSRPTKTLRNEDLKFLTIDQVLADMAHFIESKQNEDSRFKNVPWIVFGCSYPGAIAAWARVKYPNLVWASVASSAPVHTKYNFHEYANVAVNVMNRVKAGCGDTVYQANKNIVQNLENGMLAIQMSNKFQTCAFLNRTRTDLISKFFSFLATYTYPFIQNKHLKRSNNPNDSDIFSVCDMLTDRNNGERSLDRYYTFLKKYALVTPDACFPIEISPSHEYTEYKQGDNKQWDYMKCNELGYFLTTTDQDNSRAFGPVTPGYYLKECQLTFGNERTIESTVESIEATNKKYGGRHPDATNLIFPYGSDDPWTPLTVTYSENEGVVPIRILGHAHCQDVGYATNDTPELKKAQDKIQELLDQYINIDYQWDPDRWDGKQTQMKIEGWKDQLEEWP